MCVPAILYSNIFTLHVYLPALYHVAVSLNDVKDIEDPLNKVEAGLVGGDIPLQSVHIKAKLLDLAAQVITQQWLPPLYKRLIIFLCTGGSVTSL